MLIFNDGPPRAGKSYDTMLRHVLPSLLKGRDVYARLDGIDKYMDRIAAHLKMPEARVRALLHHVSADDVVSTFQCIRNGDVYSIPEHLKNALVIIDEVHEFYPAGMKPLDKAQEQFFARHGQFGMDIVCASQAFDRLHAEVRVRVERKVLFRKLSHFAALSAIGMGGKGRYSMRFYVSDGNGRFKVIKSEMHKYDPAIFQLYDGFQPGVTNTETYEAGTTEAGGWGLKVYLPLAIVAAGVGIWFVFRFFDPEESGLVKASEKTNGATVARPPGIANAAPSLPGVTRPAKEYKRPGVAYVMRMLSDHRPRLLGTHTRGDGTTGVVLALVSSQGHNAEVFTQEQLVALGFVVDVQPFGVMLIAEEERVVVTQWPNDRWGAPSERATEAAAGSAGTRRSAGTSPGGGPSVTLITAPPSGATEPLGAQPGDAS